MAYLVPVELVAAESYDPARRCEHSDPAQGERRLWLAVLDMAMSDALGTTGVTAVGDSTTEARAWWRRRPRRALVGICRLLGLEVGWVRRMAEARIREAERAEDRLYEEARRRRECGIPSVIGNLEKQE